MSAMAAALLALGLLWRFEVSPLPDRAVVLVSLPFTSRAACEQARTRFAPWERSECYMRDPRHPQPRVIPELAAP